MSKVKSRIMTGVMLMIMSSASYCAGRYSLCRIKSGSMLPTIRIGEIVVIDRYSRPAKNNIAAYRIDRALVIHRYKGVRDGMAVFKGDANNTDDAPAEKKMIIGKAVYHTNILNSIEDTLGLN